MKIAITGSTGLIGQACVEHFEKKEAEVIRIARPTTQINDRYKNILWDPQKGKIDSKGLEGSDVVINLAGASVADQNWSEKRKSQIKSSRVDGTRFLVESFKRLQRPPSLLINASAIGFYGDRPQSEILTEDSHAGSGFLSSVVREWEYEAIKAKEQGIRAILLRIGVVLSTKGGALRKILPIFKMCLGGKIGLGNQIMSWVALNDLPPIMEFLILNEKLKGVFNATAPNPVSNADFTKTLASILNRPALLPLPRFMVKLLKGEMGSELLLKGAHVIPKRLLDKGFQFQHNSLSDCLKEALA